MKIFFGLLATLLLLSGAKAQEVRDTVLLYFPFDEATLTTESRTALDSFIAAYRRTPTPSPFSIKGHCDSLGSYAYNEVLAKKRVFSVHEYLLNNGIPKTAVQLAEGYGERVPLTANSTPEGRQLNRRVELVWTQPLPTPAPEPPPTTTPVTEPVDTVPTFSKETIDSVKEGSTLRLKNINFYGGRHTFLPQAMPALNELLEVMKSHPNLVIEIQGHICCLYGYRQDGMDYDSGDQRLSLNRARAVYDYLTERGINRRRMTYRGFAATVPLVYPEYTEDDRTANRRVEIKIVKK